jgi:hypothetical protein
MAWRLRFFRRCRILPGVTLNFSKRGVSLSLGGRGGRVTYWPRGTTETVGIPGTGIYWTKRSKTIQKDGDDLRLREGR